LVSLLINCSELTYVNFRGVVRERSAPDIGTGVNGPIEGASVTVSGSLDGAQSFTTDAIGNFFGTYSPPSAPSSFATKYGVSTTGGPDSFLFLDTDATMKVGLDPLSAPDADGQSFALAVAANGGVVGSVTRALGFPSSFPALVSVPRANCGVDACTSTLALSGVDNPRFTWMGEGPLLRSDSALTGSMSSNTIAVSVMHKWVRVHVVLTAPNSAAAISPQVMQAYTWDSVAYDAIGGATYNPSGLFGVPAAVISDGSTKVQSNPSLAGETDLYVWTANRLGTPGAPYQDRFKLHLDSLNWNSVPTAGNEDIVIDDAARLSGLITKTVIMHKKEDAK
jgi:hypothetical protein